jgi:hypothetical protein
VKLELEAAMAGGRGDDVGGEIREVTKRLVPFIPPRRSFASNSQIFMRVIVNSSPEHDITPLSSSLAR